MTKRVVVQMSDACHKALKQYAAFYDTTMSQVLYNCTRMQFHKQAEVCEFVDDMFDKLDIEIDKRAAKPCFSYMCFGCQRLTACKTGLYDGVVVLSKTCIDNDLVTEAGKYKIAQLQKSAGQEPQYVFTYGHRQDETKMSRTRTTRKYVTVKSRVALN